MQTKLTSLVTALLVTGAFALAADTTADLKTSTDTSTNPITGTKTAKSKYKRKFNGRNGAKHEAKVTETTKVKRNGTVEKSIDSSRVDAPSRAE